MSTAINESIMVLMLNKLIILYFHFLDWLYLFIKGCNKSHDFDHYVIEYKESMLFVSHCKKCKYTEVLTDDNLVV